jgi:hypothetical protein
MAGRANRFIILQRKVCGDMYSQGVSPGSMIGIAAAEVVEVNGIGGR